MEAAIKFARASTRRDSIVYAKSNFHELTESSTEYHSHRDLGAFENKCERF